GRAVKRTARRSVRQGTSRRAGAAAEALDRGAERGPAHGLLDLAAAQAARAHVHLLRSAVHERAHALAVRLGGARGDGVRVADALAGHAHLAADKALRHRILLDQERVSRGRRTSGHTLGSWSRGTIRTMPTTVKETGMHARHALGSA